MYTHTHPHATTTAGSTVQYAIKVESEFACSFAGTEYHSLKDAVKGIVTMSTKHPFKSTVEGGKGVALTTAATKARTASASQLALFDDDGGLDVTDVVQKAAEKKNEKVHVDGDGRLFLSADDVVVATAPAPADDGEKFDERPETPPLGANIAATIVSPSVDESSRAGGGVASHGGSGGGGGGSSVAVVKPAVAPTASSTGVFDALDDAEEGNDDVFADAAVKSADSVRGVGLFAGLDDDEYDDALAVPADKSAPAAAAESSEVEGDDDDGGGGGDDELAALMGDGDLDEDLDALLLNRKPPAPAAAAKKTSVGLFDDDDDIGGGGASATATESMGADDMDAYINANQ